jgi:hypothetical protein
MPNIEFFLQGIIVAKAEPRLAQYFRDRNQIRPFRERQ